MAVWRRWFVGWKPKENIFDCNYVLDPELRNCLVSSLMSMGGRAKGKKTTYPYKT